MADAKGTIPEINHRADPRDLAALERKLPPRQVRYGGVPYKSWDAGSLTRDVTKWARPKELKRLAEEANKPRRKR